MCLSQAWIQQTNKQLFFFFFFFAPFCNGDCVSQICGPKLHVISDNLLEKGAEWSAVRSLLYLSLGLASAKEGTTGTDRQTFFLSLRSSSFLICFSFSLLLPYYPLYNTFTLINSTQPLYSYHTLVTLTRHLYTKHIHSRIQLSPLSHNKNSPMDLQPKDPLTWDPPQVTRWLKATFDFPEDILKLFIGKQTLVIHTHSFFFFSISYQP